MAEGVDATGAVQTAKDGESQEQRCGNPFCSETFPPKNGKRFCSSVCKTEDYHARRETPRLFHRLVDLHERLKTLERKQ